MTTKHEHGLTRAQIPDIASNYGEFQFGDAQGHKRLAFAADVIEARERLRDAAPDLLAALKAMLDEDDGGMAAGQARAAIAKAEGGAA